MKMKKKFAKQMKSFLEILGFGPISSEGGENGLEKLY